MEQDKIEEEYRLDKKRLHNLAWKYFKAKDSFGNTIGYMCPYSGKIIHNPKDIVLQTSAPQRWFFHFGCSDAGQGSQSLLLCQV